jgi:hypothetical protein
MYNNKQIGFGEATLVTGGTLAPVTLVVDVVLAAIPFIISAINRGKPNPNDWQGWVALDNKNNQPVGTSAITWIIKDGQSIQNEALNILQYIRNYGTQDVLTYNSYFNRTITAEDLANKLRRGGYENEAKQLIQQVQVPAPVQAASNILSNVTKSTSSLLLYLGIGLGLFLILKKK